MCMLPEIIHKYSIFSKVYMQIFWVIGFLYYSDIHIPVYLRRKLSEVYWRSFLEIKVQSHLIIWMSAGGKGHFLIAEQVP